MATGKGLGQFRTDVANLPPRYRCTIDPEMPEHCTVEVEGIKLDIWMDDVSLYPTRHIVQIFPFDESQPKTPIPKILQSMELTGDIAEMILTISSILSTAWESPNSCDSDDEMTEIDTEFDNDDDDFNYTDDDWIDDWVDKRSALLKENYENVMNSDVELLQDVAYLDESLEALIWTKIPIPDLLDSEIFSQMEADTWGLSTDLSVWILVDIDKSDEDFKVYIRQAEHDSNPRDIVKNLVRRNQVLCVLETYIRSTVIRLLHNTVLYVGKLILERLGNISKYCSICGDKSVDIPSVKPFCCSNQLCQFQFMYVDLNGELEDILINEPFVADLLIQLAFVAARSQQLQPYPDCLVGIGDNSVKDQNEICYLIDRLPTVDYLSHVARVPNGLQDSLKQIDPRLLPLLRWIVMSNTAHIRKLEGEESMMVGLGKEWHQFKMTISTPQKEAVFQQHKESHNGNTIFAFHGSPLYNWHSILRTGLNFNKVTHGRSYGDGIYHAFHLGTSLTYTGDRGYAYAAPINGPNSIMKWKNASMEVTTMLSVNEVVLDERCFVKTSPFLVVNDTQKVQTRYLIIRGIRDKGYVECDVNVRECLKNVTYHPVPSKYRIYSDGMDFYNRPMFPQQDNSGQTQVHIPRDSFTITRTDRKKANTPLNKLELPSYASPTTTKHLQKELRNLLKSQSEEDTSIFQLDRTNLDNLYTWHVYLYNFSPELPLAQDLLRLSLSNIELEIKFGPQHPLTPPFVRVVQPRFLSFHHGGGGHVTAGGSICTSLLTMEDWSPVYSISQVLVMVHAALSSVDPRPAKIADKGCYSEYEAMEAYVRVATTHGWSIPAGWRTLFTQPWSKDLQN